MRDRFHDLHLTAAKLRGTTIGTTSDRNFDLACEAGKKKSEYDCQIKRISEIEWPLYRYVLRILLMLTVFDDDGTNYHVLVDYDRRDDGSRALYGSRQRADDGVTAAVLSAIRFGRAGLTLRGGL